MQLLKENTIDASQEKHVPIIEKIRGHQGQSWVDSAADGNSTLYRIGGGSNKGWWELRKVSETQ